MSHSPSKRRFLVTPLDAEPSQVPKDSRVVSADSIETLNDAQTVRETMLAFINGNLPFRKVKEVLRPK